MSVDTTQQQVQLLDTVCYDLNHVSCYIQSCVLFLWVQHSSRLTLSFDCVIPDEAVDQGDETPDFYINICQPLNPIPGVTCPPGASVCMDPDDGPPVVRAIYFNPTFVRFNHNQSPDIGTHQMEHIYATNSKKANRQSFYIHWFGWQGKGKFYMLHLWHKIYFFGGGGLRMFKMHMMGCPFLKKRKKTDITENELKINTK